MSSTFDRDEVPTFHPVEDWLDLFDMNSPLPFGATRLLLAILRYSRPDGSTVFGPRGRSVVRLRRLAAWAERLADPSLAAILARWLPGIEAISPLPPASDARDDRALAVLRPDWDARGDLAAIDHRSLGDLSLLEVASRGQVWLGPAWTSGDSAGRATVAKPTHRASGVYSDGFEWSYKVGRRRIARSVTLLRGRSIALLGQQEEGEGDSTEVRLDLGPGIEASPIEGSRALLLSAGRGKPTARLIPLGLPCHDRPSDRGSIAVEGRRVVIRQQGEGKRRRWLPVLICWGKPPTTWRTLTVAERSKARRGDVAAAYRVAFGPNDEGLVIYRSLAKPALRSFLGHQTSARFLVGTFDRAGEVRPLFKIGP